MATANLPWVVQQFLESCAECFSRQIEVRYIQSKSSAFSFHRVVLLIAKHRYGQHRYTVVDGLNQAEYTTVCDEQSTVGMG